MRNASAAFVLLLLAAAVFACGCMGSETAPAGPEADPGLVVGALLPLSSDYAGGGKASRVALEVAAADINDHFASIESDRRVGIIIEDTKADPAVALAKLRALDEQGVRIVIGPGTSAELEAVRAYADEHGILVVSTMSTAPSLAIAGDNVYRFVPPDTYQADVMAYYLRKQGVTAIVPVWRGDVWGDELEKLTAAAFVRGGGKVLDGVRYTPGQDHGGSCSDREPSEGPVVRVRRQRPPRLARDGECRPVRGRDEVHLPGALEPGECRVEHGHHPEDAGDPRSAPRRLRPRDL